VYFVRTGERMKDKISVPRHKKLGVTITLIVDSGVTYHMLQRIISDNVLVQGSINLEDIFELNLEKVSHEMLEYLIDNKIIGRPN